jgi:HlyD family secretion protein
VSSLLSTPAATAAGALPPRSPKSPAKRYLVALLIVIAFALVVWSVVLLYRRSMANGQNEVPTVKVARGDVSLSIFARGEIRGGSSQTLTAPMTGGTELHIRSLMDNGSTVQAGAAVVQFDTTDQEFALKEAQSDLAEAGQHIKQATAQLDADEEEDRYAFQKAQSDVELAELDARKNPILPAISAQQNDLAVAVARDKLGQLQQDRASKKATDEAGIQMQKAAQGKAQAKMITAKQNIEAMTLRAERPGYVSVKQNTNTNFFFGGMELPIFQAGDSVRPGMAVAEIPDLNHWETSANVAELDRGHLAPGNQVKVNVIALPQHLFHGRVTDIGSTSGTPWDRHFECKVALDDQSAELRPGMSARVEITTETMRNALWLPAQALFESDGKQFVYLRSGKTFVRHDVTLIRRNETRVVLSGLQRGQEVAFANPLDATPAKAKAGASPLEVLPK